MNNKLKQLKYGMAQTLKEALRQKQWSVKELSKRSGVATGTISCILNEEVDFRLQTIEKLFKPFNLSAADAFAIAEQTVGLNESDENLRDKLFPKGEPSVEECIKTLAEYIINLRNEQI